MFFEPREIQTKAVKIESLNSNGEVRTTATGFIVRFDDGDYLCSAWHVVTGIDPVDLKFKEPPAPRSIRIRSINVTERAPGMTQFGNSFDQVFPLYGPDGAPLWQQEASEVLNADLNSIGLRVPRFFDLFRIKVSLPRKLTDELAIKTDRVYEGIVRPTQKVVIVGYPYGYSTYGNAQPTPVILTRFVAGWGLQNYRFNFLIDGVCGRAMSGSPVFVEGAHGFQLVGIYLGIIYADYQEGSRIENDPQSALGRCA